MKYITNRNKYLYLKYKLNGGSKESMIDYTIDSDIIDLEHSNYKVVYHDTISLSYYENIDSDTTKILKKINYLMDIINYDYIYVSIGSAIYLINSTTTALDYKEHENSYYQIFPNFLRYRNNKNILIIIIDNLHSEDDINREREKILSNYLDFSIDEEYRFTTNITFFYNRLFLNLDIKELVRHDLFHHMSHYLSFKDRKINQDFFKELDKLLREREFNFDNIIVANFIKLRYTSNNNYIDKYIYDNLLPENFKIQFYFSDIYSSRSYNILYNYNKKLILFDPRQKEPYINSLIEIITYENSLVSEITDEKILQKIQKQNNIIKSFSYHFTDIIGYYSKQTNFIINKLIYDKTDKMILNINDYITYYEH